MLLVIQDPQESLRLPGEEYRLVTAATPEEGLNRALSEGPALILVAGPLCELVAALKARPSLEEIPQIVVTSVRHEAERLRLLQAGANDVISPDSLEELALKVASFIRCRRVAHRSEQDLQALTHSVSHDLQAPLRAISGFSEALLNDYGEILGPDGKRLLDRVCVNSRRMTAMLEGLLELSRLFRNPLHLTRIDLSVLAAELAAELRAREPERRLQMVIEAGLTVRGDARLLRILLQKLLDNAWKFTASKSDARVEVGQSDLGFYVKDNGVGFDLRYAEKLFTPFQRLHGREIEGIGLGLAVAARIATHRGGRIWAEAEVGSGATFYFTLDS